MTSRSDEDSGVGDAGLAKGEKPAARAGVGRTMARDGEAKARRTRRAAKRAVRRSIAERLRD